LIRFSVTSFGPSSSRAGIVEDANLTFYCRKILFLQYLLQTMSGLCCGQRREQAVFVRRWWIIEQGFERVGS
jgi:hypothetical protein